MPLTASSSTDPRADRRALAAAGAIILGLTILRLWCLFASPIELYPDEAQYWVWSRQLAWGYFSKPPMVAALIRLTTEIGGDAEAWVRVSSVILHGAAPLFLFGVGRRLYGARTGLLAALIYSLMPGVQLSAGVASTDAPLLFFLCAGLWTYVRLLQTPREKPGALAWSAATGLLLGLAFLSKYAAAYALAGLVLHALVSEDARRAWRPAALAVAALGLAVTLAPNIGWNAQNDFATFIHTAGNANWKDTNFFHLDEGLDFLLSQVGVFGPVPFAALALGAGLAAARGLTLGRAKGRALAPADALLLCLALPAIVAVTVQAVLARANANWAFSAYGAGSVLAAAWLVRWRARRWTAAGLAAQAALAATFLAVAAFPPLADRLGLANSLKRARGWETMTSAILDQAAAEPRLTAIAVDERFVFNEMRYYGRNRLADAPPLRMWVREASPMSHAELTSPLTPALGAKVLAVNRVREFQAEFIGDFGAVSMRPPLAVRLDSRHVRNMELFVGSGFEPRPRDPLTRLPRPAP